MNGVPRCKRRHEAGVSIRSGEGYCLVRDSARGQEDQRFESQPLAVVSAIAGECAVGRTSSAARFSGGSMSAPPSSLGVAEMVTGKLGHNSRAACVNRDEDRDRRGRSTIFANPKYWVLSTEY